MSARQEIERLRKAHGGILKPEDVVEAARARSSPLHRCFTWDDDTAAHQWRLEQARRLLRIFVTVIGNGEQPRESRMYVSLSTDREKEGGYRAIADVLSDAEMRATLLMDAELDMLRFRQKYAGLVELASVFKSMAMAMRQMPRRLARRRDTACRR